MTEDRISSSKWKNFKTHCSNNILTLDGERSYFSGNTFLRGWDVQNKKRNYTEKENSGVLRAASHLLPSKTKKKSCFCTAAFSVEKHHLEKQNQLPTKPHTLNNFNTESTREARIWSAWWVRHLSPLRVSLCPVSSHNCWFFRQHHYLGRRMAVGDCRDTPLGTSGGISSQQENTSLCSHPFLTGKPIPEIFKPLLGLPYYYS